MWKPQVLKWSDVDLKITIRIKKDKLQQWEFSERIENYENISDFKNKQVSFITKRYNDQNQVLKGTV